MQKTMQAATRGISDTGELQVRIVKERRVARSGQPYLMTRCKVKVICAWRSGDLLGMWRWHKELCLEMRR